MSKITYCIYSYDYSHVGFCEEQRFDSLLDAQFELQNLRNKRFLEEFWLVIILDE